MRKSLLIIIAALFLVSCGNNEEQADAYGSFESDDVVVSSQTSGVLFEFGVEEGAEIKAGEQVGTVDTVQLALKIDQLRAARSAVAAQTKTLVSQVEAHEALKSAAEKNLARIKAMHKDGAATDKDLDDIEAKVESLEKQIEGVKSQNAPVFAQIEAYDAQIAQVEDMIRRSKIINPIDGRVIEKYFEQSEIVAQGAPLYKIANIEELTLRVYVSGAQLPDVKLGQKADVFADKNETENKKYPGTV